jgi:adenosylcobinamide kinase/adenosylcobinamide-phosphate guanylyltransferase
MLTLILGGAGSGKSRLAQQLAGTGGRVAYIATARPDESGASDSEMAARIAHHRASRPPSWRTIEEPLELAAAVSGTADTAEVILVDCLTVWLSNLLYDLRDHPPRHIEDAARACIEKIAATARQRHVILVSNELGSGTVPEFAVTRAFRDLHGFMNQWAATAANQVILTIAGLPLYLKRLPESEPHS